MTLHEYLTAVVWLLYYGFLGLALGIITANLRPLKKSKKR